MLKLVPPLAAIALLTGCATTSAVSEAREDPDVTKALAGKVAGKPQACLPLTEADASSTYRGTILYRTSRTLTWRNDLNGCMALRADDIPVTRVYGSQICRGDLVTFVDRISGFQGGACSYGDFVPYRTPKPN